MVLFMVKWYDKLPINQIVRFIVLSQWLLVNKRKTMEYSSFVKIIVLLQFILNASTLLQKSDECVVHISNNFDNCTELVPQLIPGQKIKNICNRSLSNDVRNKTCSNNTVCTRIFNLSIFHQQLFAITMKNAVLNMIMRCCGHCFRCSVVTELEDMSHLNASFANSPDIIFPVVGFPNVPKLFGFRFLPAYDAPSAYYFTLKRPSNILMTEVLNACLKMWPLLIVFILLALMSGFIIWFMEKWKNDAFRDQLVFGIFDGFWWSFVSMTTVGYGDKVPRSYLGRLYAVLWMLIGLIICSVFTGSLTSEIMEARKLGDTDIGGKKVGVLKHRIHDIAIVAQHGGIIHTGKIYKTMDGIYDLIMMLHNKTIDGFLIDRNTYYHFSKRMKKPKYAHFERLIQRDRLLYTEKKFVHKSDKLMCGMLVKNDEDYEYFKSYFANNHLQLESCNLLKMNKKKSFENKYEVSMFASDGLFLNFLYISLIILGVFLLCGILYEVRLHFVTFARRCYKFVFQ